MENKENIKKANVIKEIQKNFVNKSLRYKKIEKKSISKITKILKPCVYMKKRAGFKFFTKC